MKVETRQRENDITLGAAAAGSIAGQNPMLATIP